MRRVSTVSLFISLQSPFHRIFVVPMTLVGKDQLTQKKWDWIKYCLFCVRILFFLPISSAGSPSNIKLDSKIFSVYFYFHFLFLFSISTFVISSKCKILFICLPFLWSRCVCLEHFRKLKESAAKAVTTAIAKNRIKSSIKRNSTSNGIYTKHTKVK